MTRNPAPSPQIAITVRTAEPKDAEAIKRIDAEGLATGHATFRETPHDWSSFQAAFGGARGLAVIAHRHGNTIAWAGVSATSTRPVYRGVGEVSIYVACQAHGSGVGHILLTDLIARSESAGYWTLTAQIFPENAASLALHRRCGFRVLGRRERLGLMPYGPLSGKWRDVLFLERRSPNVHNEQAGNIDRPRLRS